MSAFVPCDTAITASASRIAVRSIHELIAYPDPNCSAFHARNGSSECVVSTNGIPYSFFARKPAIDTYHVCVCTMSMRSSSFICDRFSASASTAVLNFASVPAVTSGGGSSPITCRFPASARCVPQQCTSTSISFASSRLRYSTCTPAPPYTSGEYTRVATPTRIHPPPIASQQHTAPAAKAEADSSASLRNGKRGDAAD